MVSKFINKLPLIFFLIGIFTCSFPLVSDMIQHFDQRNAISTYKNSIEKEDTEQLEEMLKKAEVYNNVLFQTNGNYVANSVEILNEENYQKLLNQSDTGVMGSIEIPNINVNLPIYHGTDEDVLSNGIGHVMDSSLPIGGVNTRCLLTGHRGLPTSKLFTRLDELKKNDLFYIHVFDKTLAYQVDLIEVIEPEEVERLDIIPGEDRVSLITCTPYGVNTHRLVITGKRVPYKEKEKSEIKQKIPSFREIAYTCLPLLFVGFSGYPIVKEKIRREKAKHEETKNS